MKRIQDIIKWAKESSVKSCIGMVYEDDVDDLRKAVVNEGWDIVFTRFGMAGNPSLQFEITKP